MAVVQRGCQNHRPDAQDNTYTLVQADANNRIRVVVTYQVDGNTNQESASRTTDYPVLAVRIGATSELEFDPKTVSRTISEGDKGRNVGAPVTATGNHGTIRYSLATGAATTPKGSKIDEKTGQITTDMDLDYEGVNPATAGPPVVIGSCAGANGSTPVRECTVTVTARPTPPALLDRPELPIATVTIKITDVDEKPAFSTGAKTVSVPENSTALFGAEDDGYTIDAVADVTYTAMDPEGRTVSYSLAGPDASKFQLSGSPPVLSFVSGPDFEAKASADRDNVYEVTVRASAGGDTGERMVRVTVSNVDEAPEIIQGGLSISGPSSRDYAEDGTDAVGAYTARGENAARARWTLEGDDAMYFKVGTARGAMTELMFKSAPDYEMPRGRAMSDANTNVYMVTLKATEGTDMDTHEVTVTVINVDEMGMVAAISGAARVDSELTAGMVTDPDGSVSGERWTWERSMNGTAWSAISGATLSTYTAMAGDVGYYLRVSVTYTDGQGSGKMAMSAMTAAKVVAVGAVDPLITRYAGDDGVLQKSEMIDAINDHVFGDGDDRISKDDMIKVINLHVFG